MEFSFTEWPEQEITPEDIRDAAYLDGYDAAIKHIEHIIDINDGRILEEIGKFIWEYRNTQ